MYGTAHTMIHVVSQRLHEVAHWLHRLHNVPGVAHRLHNCTQVAHTMQHYVGPRLSKRLHTRLHIDCTGCIMYEDWGVAQMHTGCSCDASLCWPKVAQEVATFSKAAPCCLKDTQDTHLYKTTHGFIKVAQCGTCCTHIAYTLHTDYKFNKGCSCSAASWLHIVVNPSAK